MSNEMAMTRAFSDTMVSRMQHDPAYRQALLAEAAQAILGGDVDTGKVLLRDYVRGTIGLQALGSATGARRRPVTRKYVGAPRQANSRMRTETRSGLLHV